MIHRMRPGRSRIICLIASGILVFLVVSTPSRAQSLESVLRPLLDHHAGYATLAVEHLKTGQRYGYRADEVMPTASLIKFPVMVAAYRGMDQGKWQPSDRIQLRRDDQVQGSGILTHHFSEGLNISFRDAIRLMIAFSDNTATNLVTDHIGLSTTSTTMVTLGFAETQLHSKVFRRDTSLAPERSRQYGLGSTTANDMVRLMKMLHDGKLASQESSQAMLDHLLSCDDQTCLVAKLPPNTKVAHKSGAVTGTRTDAGLMMTPSGPIAIAVLTRDNKDMSWSDTNAGNVLCADLARAVYDYFNPNQTANANPGETTLQMGSTGPKVKALQRTLNGLLKGALLGVDGEFGPATRAAVVAFQTEKSLATSGVVDEATWKALGPLRWDEELVPDPDVIAAESLPKKPAEPLEGPPVVTSKAWAVADADSGEVLWNENGDQPLDMASVTKIMTALLVLELAKEDPRVLEEEVAFSQLADDTIGSTSDLRAGEKVRVHDLLYGLLLPSGNDASVALGEHFGSRLGEPDRSEKGGASPGGEPTPKSNSLSQFVQAMNRKAFQLGLARTRFANTSGLTDNAHHSTAVELAKLSHACLQHALFRTITSTRQYGCTVQGPGGYQRNVKWTNTNQLLERDGYGGIKTGTTDRAGACLAALGEKEGRRLIIVILGSASSPSRYSDARNLFRWSWSELGRK